MSAGSLHEFYDSVLNPPFQMRVVTSSTYPAFRFHEEPAHHMQQQRCRIHWSSSGPARDSMSINGWQSATEIVRAHLYTKQRYGHVRDGPSTAGSAVICINIWPVKGHPCDRVIKLPDALTIGRKLWVERFASVVEHVLVLLEDFAQAIGQTYVIDAVETHMEIFISNSLHIQALVSALMVIALSASAFPARLTVLSCSKDAMLGMQGQLDAFPEGMLAATAQHKAL